MFLKNENSKQYLGDVIARNGRTCEDITKKAFEIDQIRQDQHIHFKVALENIIKRLKDYEADCEKRGIVIEHKYGHLDKVAEDEQARIVEVNA